MAKKKASKGKRILPWCWYCDREFEDDKVLIMHQKAKHFKCSFCNRRLNSASGLVVHIAQMHKETVDSVPCALPGHDTPELEIFGMQGIPPEDLQRHLDGLPIVPYRKARLADAGLISLLAAQKAAHSGNPLPMSSNIPITRPLTTDQLSPPPVPAASIKPPHPVTILPPLPFVPMAQPVPTPIYPNQTSTVLPVALTPPFMMMPPPSVAVPVVSPLVTTPPPPPPPRRDSQGEQLIVIPAHHDPATGRNIPTAVIKTNLEHISMEERRSSLSKYNNVKENDK